VRRHHHIQPQEVQITDCGPYATPQRRIIDLLRAATDSLIELGAGRVRVTLSELPPYTPQSGKKQIDEEALDYEAQVGAFTDSEQVQWVLEQMLQRYPAASIAPHDGSSGPLYCIRIRLFAPEEREQKVAQDLKREGHRIFLDGVPEGN
jgi:hypothetical protein